MGDLVAAGGWIASTVDYEAEGIPRPKAEDTDCPEHIMFSHAGRRPTGTVCSSCAAVLNLD